MKNNIKSFITCIVIVCMVACSPMTKESYLKKFDTFLTEVFENQNKYNENDWMTQTKKYEKFSGEWYDKFKNEFTLKDQIHIKANQAKWYYYNNLHNATNTVKQLFDTIDVIEIKKQLQYYIDNSMTDDLQKFYEGAQKASKDTQEAIAEILKELNVKIEELQK